MTMMMMTRTTMTMTTMTKMTMTKMTMKKVMTVMTRMMRGVMRKAAVRIQTKMTKA